MPFIILFSSIKHLSKCQYIYSLKRKKRATNTNDYPIKWRKELTSPKKNTDLILHSCMNIVDPLAVLARTFDTP